jgi:hypothetical protein
MFLCEHSVISFIFLLIIMVLLLIGGIVLSAIAYKSDERMLLLLWIPLAAALIGVGHTAYHQARELDGLPRINQTDKY